MHQADHTMRAVHTNRGKQLDAIEITAGAEAGACVAGTRKGASLGESQQKEPLPLRIVDSLAKIEPDDDIRGAVPLRLRFIPERRQRNSKGDGDAARDDQRRDHACSAAPEVLHR